MKISPATQLIMKAVVNAAVRKALNLNLFLNLNPRPSEAEIKKKLTIKIKSDPAASTT